MPRVELVLEDDGDGGNEDDEESNTTDDTSNDGSVRGRGSVARGNAGADTNVAESGGVVVFNGSGWGRSTLNGVVGERQGGAEGGVGIVSSTDENSTNRATGNDDGETIVVSRGSEPATNQRQQGRVGQAVQVQRARVVIRDLSSENVRATSTGRRSPASVGVRLEIVGRVTR